MPIFQADLPMFGFYVGGKIIVVNKIGYLEPHHVICRGYKKVPIFFLLGIFLHKEAFLDKLAVNREMEKGN